MGAARTLIFFARWLQPESLDLSPANLSGRMREWADILVTDLHRGDSTPLPVEPVPITVDQAHTLSLPTPPHTPEELATILSTTFLLVPEARFFGAPLGDFFKALRVQLRPRTASAEQALAYMFRPALALIPSFRVDANTVWMRTPPHETPADGTA